MILLVMRSAFASVAGEVTSLGASVIGSEFSTIVLRLIDRGGLRLADGT